MCLASRLESGADYELMATALTSHPDADGQAERQQQTGADEQLEPVRQQAAPQRLLLCLLIFCR